MNPLAISKAQVRVRIAQKAVGDLEACRDYETFTQIWFTFLNASKSVYTVLEQGAKASARSRQWFGAKAEERRRDPLLQYVYQARNNEEHGLLSSSEHVPGSLAIGVNKPGFSAQIRFDTDASKGLVATSLDGKPVLIEQTLPHVKLIRVHGRDAAREIYDPPEMHGGLKIADTSPLGVAKLMVTYLAAMVSEAALLG